MIDSFDLSHCINDEYAWGSQDLLPPFDLTLPQIRAVDSTNIDLQRWGDTVSVAPPILSSPAESIAAPRTPADGSVQAGLNIPHQLYSDMAYNTSTGDLFEGHLPLYKESTKNACELFPQANTIPSTSLTQPELPAATLNQTLPSIIVSQPLSFQDFPQLDTSASFNHDIAFDQPPVYGLENYGFINLSDMHPHDNLCDMSVRDPFHFPAQWPVSNAKIPASCDNDFVSNQLLDLDTTLQGLPTPVVLEPSSTLVGLPILPEVSDHDLQSILNNTFVDKFTPSQKVALKPLAPNRQTCTATNKSESYIPYGNNSHSPLLPKPSLSSSSMPPPALPKDLKRKRFCVDMPESVPKHMKPASGLRPTRSIGSSSAKSSGSANEPSSGSSSLVLDCDELVIPLNNRYGSLIGLGERYYTLSKINKAKNARPIAKKNKSLKNFACKYIGPELGDVCFMLGSNQDPEWLMEITQNKRKSMGFFPRNEAEWLRHLAMHRHDEWIKSLRNWDSMGSNATEWDDERIDEQIMKDIEEPEAQVWYRSEKRNRNEEVMIEWLKASRKSNKYNRKRRN
ncbi:hypothetical protein RHS03_01630, partial [Rhizoctonia solani]